MLRTECAGCGHAGLTVFADLGETPLADVFEPDRESAVSLPRYPLRVAMCSWCHLAQLLDVVDDKLLYGDDYGFRTGGSPSSLKYMRDLAYACAIYSEHVPAGLTVEIGCNDGTLLAELRALGASRPLGIDPSGAALVAGDRGLDVMREPFTAAMVRDGGGLAGHASLVVAVNVAAHVQDPHDFLEGIHLLLGPDGVAVVEFQYLPDLLAGCMFDLIYHEHRFFFTLDSFQQLAGAHGLVVRAVERTPAQGGSLRVVLGRITRTEYSGWVSAERRQVYGLVQGFQERAEYARDRIVDTVRSYPGIVCGYAASAKSCTLLNWCKLGPDELPYVLDATPSKSGRFTPGSGIRIVGPANRVQAPDAFLLLASNYLGGILHRELGYPGQFIVPLPLPVIV